MNKNEIIDYLQQQQLYFHNTFGINFIGLFSRGDETKDSDIDTLKPKVKEYIDRDLIYV